MILLSWRVENVQADCKLQLVIMRGIGHDGDGFGNPESMAWVLDFLNKALNNKQS